IVPGGVVLADTGRHRVFLRASTDSAANHAGVPWCWRPARIAVLGCWLGSAAIAAALPMHYLGRTAAAGEFLALTLALVPLSLAAVVNRRAPDHPAGAVLAAAGLCWVIAFIPSDVEAGVFGGTWML